jgi:hypothetical protein
MMAGRQTADSNKHIYMVLGKPIKIVEAYIVKA